MCMGWQNSGLESQDKKNITLLGGGTLLILSTLSSLAITLFLIKIYKILICSSLLKELLNLYIF